LVCGTKAHVTIGWQHDSNDTFGEQQPGTQVLRQTRARLRQTATEDWGTFCSSFFEMLFRSGMGSRFPWPSVIAAATAEQSTDWTAYRQALTQQTAPHATSHDGALVGVEQHSDAQSQRTAQAAREPTCNRET
jgi:hypothetical protein